VVDVVMVNSGDLEMVMVLEADEVDEVVEAVDQTEATVFRLVGLIGVVVMVPRGVAVEIVQLVVLASWARQKVSSHRIT
jgi:hypothetical protein